MNREIKFRVWREDYKKFDYPDLTFAIGRMSESAEQSGYVLQQFTGLKDKNGKDIYEEDVVNQHDVMIRVCKWNPARCEFAWYKGDQYICPIGDDRKSAFIEVIGNTYQNPELIK